MSEIANKLRSQIESLSREDRAELAYVLLESLDEESSQDEVDDLWERELNRRWEDIKSGREKGVPAAEVFARLRGKSS